MNLDIVYRKVLINLCVCVQISNSQELTAFSAYFFSCPDRTSFFLENPSLFSQNYDSTFSGPMAEKWHWHTEGDNHSDRHQWLTLRWSCGLAGSCEVPVLTYPTSGVLDTEGWRVWTTHAEKSSEKGQSWEKESWQSDFYL